MWASQFAPSEIFWCLCSSIQDLKERIRQRTNLPLGPSIDTHGETFLSQEVVVNLLQETKQAFERCHRVSSLPAVSIREKMLCIKSNLEVRFDR